MDSEQTFRRQLGQSRGNPRAPVAALCHVFGVVETAHEFGPCSRRTLGGPAGARGLIREAETRQRRDDDMEGILSLATIGNGSVSGPIVFANSRTEPSQPWLSRIGNAFYASIEREVASQRRQS